MLQEEVQDGKRQNIRMQDGKKLVMFMEMCYQLYEQKMYRAAYRILQDSIWAEDAVQEAFLKLMKGRVYFEDACSDECKKYLITVIRHAAIDIYNMKKREREFVCFGDEALYGERAAAEDMVREDVDIKEMISVLSPRYYEVVDYLAIKNLSVEETAKRLGISEANVRKRFERAKKKLKQALQK